MKNESVKPRLTQEEILSTLAVFLLAAWFLSHYLFNETAEKAVIQPSSKTFTQPVLLDDVTTIYSQSDLHYDQFGRSPQIANIGQTLTSPSQFQRHSLQNTNISQSHNSKKNVVFRGSDLPLFKSDFPSAQKQISTVQQPRTTEQPEDISVTVPLISNQTTTTTVMNNSQPQIALCHAVDNSPPRKRNTPGIKSIKTDSNHMLRLKGTAEPDSELTVLLNGQSEDGIHVSNTGEWLYSAKLTPGKYAVQVKDALCEKQSKQFQVYFPEKKITIQSNPSVPITKDKVLIKQAAKPPVSKKESEDHVAKNEHSGQVKKQQHRVRSGDTLYSLARRYHVSVLAMKKANKLTSKHVLSIGQVLKIPGSKHP